MKFSEQEVKAMLAKALGDVVADDEPADKNDDKVAGRLGKIEKAILGLTDFVSKNINVEKPKTMEEIVKETEANLMKNIAKALGKEINDKGEMVAVKTDDKDDKNAKIGDLSKEGLAELVTGVVSKMLEDKVVKTSKSKGKKDTSNEGIDAIINLIAKENKIDMENKDDSAVEETEDEEEVAKEDEKDDDAAEGEEVAKDAAFYAKEKNADGSALSKEQIASRKALDGHLQKSLKFEFAKRGIFQKDDE